METLAFALGVSIVIVIVLLMSCRKNKKPAVPVASAGPAVQTASSASLNSDYGTGVQNRRVEQRVKDLTGLSGYDDYNEVTQYTALEPEVYQSHEEYSKDINRSTAGASMGSVRSDDINYVPFVGLRRPDYHGVTHLDGNRQDYSVYEDQMPKSTPFVL